MSETNTSPKPTFDIMIVGVGGQGAILLGQFLQEFGLQHQKIASVVATASRGVSQREGSVHVFVRYLLKNINAEIKQSSQISPLIPHQSCDLLIALEPLEFLRNLEYVSPNAIIVVNEQSIVPKSVILKKKTYPDIKAAFEQIQKTYSNVQFHVKNYTLDALNANENIVIANYLLCQDLPKIYPTLFDVPLFQQLLDHIFNLKKK